jgi:hypothetical protein
MPTFRFSKLTILSLLLAVSLFPLNGWAQGKPGSAGGGNTGGARNTGTSNTPNISPGIPNTLPTHDSKRPIYLTGTVVLDHGRTLSQPVSIIRVCGGNVRHEGHTDVHGHFGIVLGESADMPESAESGQGLPTQGAFIGVSPRQLWNCEIRAELAGYTSSDIMLAGRDFSGSPDIGTLVLTKIGGGGGEENGSISVISLKAPDNARREYAKAVEDCGRQKFDSADKHLAKAVAIYPQYAVAWELRGQEQQKLKQRDEARKSYQAAIAADEKFVTPYLRLARLESSVPNWQEVLRLTDRAIHLDPANYPDAYFLNGAAHFNLGQLPEAERSAKKASELDKQHRLPRTELLLGMIADKTGDHATAAKHLSAYLQLEPNSPEAAQIQTYLARVGQQDAAARPEPKQ